MSESDQILRCARVDYSSVTQTGPMSDLLFPRHHLHFPTIVCGTQPHWNIEQAISVAQLKSTFGSLECVLVDLGQPPEVVEKQRNEEIHQVSEYFDSCQTRPLLYMTEVYMRGVCPEEATRPYPRCVFSEDNWFHTDVPGRLESFFLGNQGTYGIIHHDKIFGVGFLYMMTGVKRVMFFPPESERLLRETFQPNFRRKHFGMELSAEDVKGIRACQGQVAYVHPGELLVIPQGWWHQITNVEGECFSYVDMVLTKDHLLNFCSTTEPDKFSLQHTLREIIPYRLRLAQTLAEEIPRKRERLRDSEPRSKGASAEHGKEKPGLYGMGSSDAFAREWDLVHGFLELQRGLSAMIANLSVPDEVAEFADYQRQVAEASFNLQRALLQ